MNIRPPPDVSSVSKTNTPLFDDVIRDGADEMSLITLFPVRWMVRLSSPLLISPSINAEFSVNVLVGFGVSLWMYGTPVVYPLSQITNDKLSLLIRINPVTQALETFRYIFLGAGQVSFYWWTITIIITAVILFIGIILFNKVEKTFMDTI